MGGLLDSKDSALSRLLFDKDDDGNVQPFGNATPTDTQAKAALRGARGRIARERSRLRSRSSVPPSRWSGPAEGTTSLTVSAFDRGIDWRWRRTSFSDISANAFEPRVASEPEERSEPDETTGTPEALTAPNGHELRDVVSPFGNVEVSVRFGTFVHRVLQAADFAAPDLDQELRRQVLLERSRTDLDLEDPEVLVSALRGAIETPLGPTIEGATPARSATPVTA